MYIDAYIHIYLLVSDFERGYHIAIYVAAELSRSLIFSAPESLAYIRMQDRFRDDDRIL